AAVGWAMQPVAAFFCAKYLGGEIDVRVPAMASVTTNGGGGNSVRRRDARVLCSPPRDRRFF
ncbi:hypothetical protein P1940_20745, partial [Xanthomonas perforans]